MHILTAYVINKRDRPVSQARFRVILREVARSGIPRLRFAPRGMTGSVVVYFAENLPFSGKPFYIKGHGKQTFV